MPDQQNMALQNDVSTAEPVETRFVVSSYTKEGGNQTLVRTDDPNAAMAAFEQLAKPAAPGAVNLKPGENYALTDEKSDALSASWVAEGQGGHMLRFAKDEGREAFQSARFGASLRPSEPSVGPLDTVEAATDKKQVKASEPTPDTALVDDVAKQKPSVIGEITGDEKKERVPGQALVPSMDYTVDKAGKVTYTVDGKPIVSDAAKGVTVVTPTAEAYALALQVAVERYGPTLTLDGDPAFVRAMTEAARESGLKLTLHDASKSNAPPLVLSSRDVEVKVDAIKETLTPGTPAELSGTAVPVASLQPKETVAHATWADVSQEQKLANYVDLAARREVTLPTTAPAQLHYENALGQQARGDAGWENMPSVPGASMRMNLASHVAEVHVGGHDETISGLGAINAWCKDHHASEADRERLVAFDVAASRGISQEQSKPTINEKETAMATPAKTTLPVSDVPSQPREEIKRIGDYMPKADWQETIDILKSKSPEMTSRAAVYMPKAGADYSGKVLMITETHIVQQVGRGTAVAHDLSKLENGKELNADIDRGAIKVGMQTAFKYDQDKGKGEVVTFTQQRNTEVKRELQEWAKEAMPNARTRDSFLKHLEAGMVEISKQKTMPTPAKSPLLPQMAPAKAPGRDR